MWSSQEVSVQRPPLHRPPARTKELKAYLTYATSFASTSLTYVTSSYNRARLNSMPKVLSRVLQLKLHLMVPVTSSPRDSPDVRLTIRDLQQHDGRKDTSPASWWSRKRCADQYLHTPYSSTTEKDEHAPDPFRPGHAQLAHHPQSLLLPDTHTAP